MTASLTITPQVARQLAVSKQRLAGPRPAPDAAGLLELVRALGCVQLDPISAVERSHRLVLFSRLGRYAPAEFDRLVYQDRHLFEYWAHCASIVLTEDYPLFRRLMRRYPWSARTAAWVENNQPLRRYVLDRLRRDGPLLSRDLEEAGLAPKAWVSTGWTSGRNISRMLDVLWIGGQIMVAGRQGLQKQWDLTRRVLPEWAPRQALSERQVTRRAAEQAAGSLGPATALHIQQHFIRGFYTDLPRALADLTRAGRLTPIQVRGPEGAWPGQWRLPTTDLPLVEALQRGEWQPRTTLLSPFDNLICDRKRAQLLFDFDFKIEIYVPAAKRRYGYYVLPILHGERLIGRLDPSYDRAQRVLRIQAVHREPGAPDAAGPAVARAVQELAEFLGAAEISYNKRQVPPGWKRALISS